MRTMIEQTSSAQYDKIIFFNTSFIHILKIAEEYRILIKKIFKIQVGRAVYVSGIDFLAAMYKK